VLQCLASCPPVAAALTQLKGGLHGGCGARCPLAASGQSCACWCVWRLLS